MNKSIYCSFCNRAPFGTIGELNTHYRQFLPELSIYLGRRSAKSKPPHPVDILREFLRLHSSSTISALLDDPTKDEHLKTVLNAFASQCYTDCYGREDKWTDRQHLLVTLQHWEDMVSASLAKYKGHRNKRRMVDQVRNMVERAIESTYRHDDEDDDAKDDDAKDGQGGLLQPIELSDEDDDEEQDLVDAAGNVPPAVEVNVGDVGRGLMVANDINFGIQIHGEPKKHGASDRPMKRKNQSPKNTVKGEAKSKRATSRFAAFPILLLSVDILDTIIVVPAENDTTFEDVKRLVDQHADNPLKGAGVQVALHGTREWNCLWTEDVWKAVKAQANTTAEPTIYPIRFRIATAEVVA